jgi:hypothetical protein
LRKCGIIPQYELIYEELNSCPKGKNFLGHRSRTCTEKALRNSIPCSFQFREQDLLFFDSSLSRFGGFTIVFSLLEGVSEIKDGVGVEYF